MGEKEVSKKYFKIQEESLKVNGAPLLVDTSLNPNKQIKDIAANVKGWSGKSLLLIL